MDRINIKYITVLSKLFFKRFRWSLINWIAVVTMLIFSNFIAAASDVPNIANYNKWENLPISKLRQMGYDFVYKDMLIDSALLCYTIVANRQPDDLDEEELDQYIGVVRNIGSLYLYFYNDYFKAYSFLIDAEELAKKYHREKMLSYVYIDLANLYLLEHELNTSDVSTDRILCTYKKAFNIGIKYKEWTPIFPSFTSMAEIAFGDRNLLAVNKEIEVFKKLDIPDSIPEGKYVQMLCKGLELWKEGDKDKAINIFQTLSFNEDGNIDCNSINSYNLVKHIILHNAYLQMGQRTKALEELRLLEVESVKDGVIDGLAAAYTNYINFYDGINDQKLSDKYQLKWYHLRDSVVNGSRLNEVNTVRFLREIDKMHDQHKQLVIEQKHRSRMLWILSAFLVFALVSFALLALNYRRIHQKNCVLYENNLALLAADEQRRCEAKIQTHVNDEQASSKYGANKLEDDAIEELWQNIVHVMEYSQEIYNELFSLNRLSELVGAKSHQISQVINSQGDWTFFALLAHYRIKKACQRMNDVANYGNYTIESIGQSVGFRSRSNFVKLFKKEVGITPSEYLKIARSKTDSK